jgi:4-hydroxy-3-polyprenylbenzoate decarboxylase
MAYKNLRDFISLLEKKGELVRVKTPVSPDLEITEIADRVMKSEGGGKALLFENCVDEKHPGGFGVPVLINAFGSRKRMSWALGVEDLEEIAERIESLIKTPQEISRNPSFLNKLQQLPQLLQLADSFPKTVSRGACQEVILKGDEVDLTKFPILKCWPGDGGNFITLPMVFTRDPKTLARNVGMYRMQIFDKNTTGMHWQKHKTGARHYEEYRAMQTAHPPSPSPQEGEIVTGLRPATQSLRGESSATPTDFENQWTSPASLSAVALAKEEAGRHNPAVGDQTPKSPIHSGVGTEVHGIRGAESFRIPVSVALGGDPVLTYAATAPLPEGIDEIVFAGWLRGKSVEMVKCLTNDLEVPADAEIILEGYVDPAEPLRREGPFGDHTGYYSLADDYPAFHVTAITHRKNPIYPATIVGIPPMEDAWLGKASERIFLPLLKMQLPEIVDLNLPIEGVFHNLAIVSIKKRYPGQARKVACALWGLGQMMFAKMIVVVDAEVNVQNYRELLWRVGNNISPQRDVFFVEGPIDSLDHSSPLPNYGSKMGIDATKKLSSEGFNRDWPEILEMSPEVKKKINGMWRDLGI